MDADLSSSSPGFSLKGQNEAFTARRDSIFGNLPVVQLESPKTEPTEGQSSISTVTSDQTEEDTNDITIYKGEESIFKRPMPKLKRPSVRPRKQPFPPKLRSDVPDYKRNPQKWIKYSLASTSDMTDRSNTAAAFAFLREIEERKRKESMAFEDKDEGGKVIFKKPKAMHETTEKKKTYREGKLVMPAFEFGSKKPSKPKSKSGIPDNTKAASFTLSHLQEDEEDQ